MIAIRELKIKDWSGYFFEEMINMLDIDPKCFMVSDIKCINGNILYNICYSDKIGVPHIVFNNIDCYLKKNGDYKFLVFCDNNKNKTMINIYLKIIKQIYNEMFSFIDEFEDEKLYFDGDSTRFKFEIDDNLVYDEKINIPVCVISLSSVITKNWIYCPILKLPKCLYEDFS